MRRSLLLLVAVALFTLGPSAWASYTIVTKSGDRIDAKEKYRVEGDQAIIVRPNGTALSYPLAEIDIARTEEANRNSIGTAVDVTDPRRDQAYGTNKPAAPAGNLTELIERRGATQERISAPPPAAVRKPEPARGSIEPAQIRRQPFARADVAAEILRILGGTDLVGVYQGRATGRPLVEIKVVGERDVFLALSASAEAVVALQQKFPAQVPALELYLRTSGGERAGQFTLTPDLVAQLVGKRQTAASFFLENVEF